MHVQHSILFTRPLQEGEGAKVQQDELDRVANADMQNMIAKGYVPINESIISEDDHGAIKFLIAYTKTPEVPQQ